jgi:2-polyprenyl-3-methyl-5-hydroxy-6-metoxy-1,4-benzoquinol methylase
VLDVGAGAMAHEFTVELAKKAQQLDGVDPSEGIHQHPMLSQRWHATLESADVPTEAYDLAYSYNVVEHVPAARPFFEKLAAVLKPGGVYWAVTPHAKHPFCKIVRSIEVGGLSIKRWLSARAETNQINAYSSYYRLNKSSQVLAAIEGLGFASAHFVYMPCLHWDSYFPRPLRWVPNLYDYVLGTRYRPFMLMFAFRLEKAR